MPPSQGQRESQLDDSSSTAKRGPADFEKAFLVYSGGEWVTVFRFLGAGASIPAPFRVLAEQLQASIVLLLTKRGGHAWQERALCSAGFVVLFRPSVFREARVAYLLRVEGPRLDRLEGKVVGVIYFLSMAPAV